jgi:hypothetical protein
MLVLTISPNEHLRVVLDLSEAYRLYALKTPRCPCVASRLDNRQLSSESPKAYFDAKSRMVGCDKFGVSLFTPTPSDCGWPNPKPSCATLPVPLLLVHSLPWRPSLWLTTPG